MRLPVFDCLEPDMRAVVGRPRQPEQVTCRWPVQIASISASWIPWAMDRSDPMSPLTKP